MLLLPEARPALSRTNATLIIMHVLRARFLAPLGLGAAGCGVLIISTSTINESKRQGDSLALAAACNYPLSCARMAITLY